MSLAIVLGYSGTKRTDEVINLYTGNDLAEARRLLESPAPGIRRTELIINPAPARRKIYEAEETVTPPADETITAPAELSLEEPAAPPSDENNKRGRK